MRRLALKSASTLYVVSRICWSVATKKSKPASGRAHPSRKDLGNMDVNEVIEKLQQEIRSQSSTTGGIRY